MVPVIVVELALLNKLFDTLLGELDLLLLGVVVGVLLGALDAREEGLASLVRGELQGEEVLGDAEPLLADLER